MIYANHSKNAIIHSFGFLNSTSFLHTKLFYYYFVWYVKAPSWQNYSEKNFPLKELLKGTTWVLKDLWWDIQFSKKVRKFCQKIIEKLGNFIIQNHWSPRTRSGFPIEGRAQYKGLKIETNQEEQDSENRSVGST